MRRPPSPAGTGTADDDKGATELATVIYDTPHVIKEHNDQSAISTQDNVAYGGTIPHKKQNEDYEQVHINWTIILMNWVLHTDELSHTL